MLNYFLGGGKVTLLFESLLLELLEDLATHDGVTVKGNRVCYTPELVEAARKQVPLDDTNYACSKAGDDRFRLVPPFSPFDVIDFDSGDKRPAEDRYVIDGDWRSDPHNTYVESNPFGELNSIIEVNPQALEIATALDEERQVSGPRGLMHGIPVVLKANIDTADQMTRIEAALGRAG